MRNSFREWVYIIVESNRVVIFLSSFTSESLILWELKILTVVLFKVILGMALCTNQ